MAECFQCGDRHELIPDGGLCPACRSAVQEDLQKAKRIWHGPRFEYRTVSLSGGMDGIAAVEQKLMAWGADGWRLLPMAISGGSFGIMEREIRA